MNYQDIERILTTILVDNFLHVGILTPCQPTPLFWTFNRCVLEHNFSFMFSN